MLYEYFNSVGVLFLLFDSLMLNHCLLCMCLCYIYIYIYKYNAFASLCYNHSHCVLFCVVICVVVLLVIWILFELCCFLPIQFFLRIPYAQSFLIVCVFVWCIYVLDTCQCLIVLLLCMCCLLLLFSCCWCCWCLRCTWSQVSNYTYSSHFSGAGAPKFLYVW